MTLWWVNVGEHSSYLCEWEEVIDIFGYLENYIRYWQHNKPQILPMRRIHLALRQPDLVMLLDSIFDVKKSFWSYILFLIFFFLSFFNFTLSSSVSQAAHFSV